MTLWQLLAIVSSEQLDLGGIYLLAGLQIVLLVS